MQTPTRHQKLPGKHCFDAAKATPPKKKNSPWNSEGTETDPWGKYSMQTPKRHQKFTGKHCFDAAPMLQTTYRPKWQTDRMNLAAPKPSQNGFAAANSSHRNTKFHQTPHPMLQATYRPKWQTDRTNFSTPKPSPNGFSAAQNSHKHNKIHQTLHPMLQATYRPKFALESFEALRGASGTAFHAEFHKGSFP